MDFTVYKEKIKERLIGYFDIEENFNLKGLDIDLYGICNVRSEKYIASKSFTVFAFENDEHVLLKYFTELNEENLFNYIELLKDSINEIVNPHDEHMSSTISGVLVVDRLEDKELIKKIEKFKYQKGFLFGLKGWVDVRLILIDLHDEKVITCKKGKKAIKFYKP